MASHPRTPAAREERRLDVRKLAIASIASASAAVIVSQFWVAGTWMAAALTPVFVILIQEALHKPTEVLAQRITSPRAEALPEATGAGAPPPATARLKRDEPTGTAPTEPGTEPGSAPEPPVRVYRTGAGGGPARPRSRRRKMALGTLALTALLAFAISAFAITGTELVTGGSIGKGDRDTTLFGGDSRSDGGRPETTTEQRQSRPEQQREPQSAPPGGAEHRGREQDNQETAPAQPEGGQTAPSPAPQTTTP